MKITASIWLFLLALTAFPQAAPPGYPYPNPLSTNGNITGAVLKVTGPINPTSYSDPFPAVWDDFFGGGYRAVGTTTERDAINAAFRKQGMLVWVAADNHTYQLDSDLTAWTDLGILGAGGADTNWALNNLTLDADRFHDGATHSVTMFDFGTFAVTADTITQESDVLHTVTANGGYSLTTLVGTDVTITSGNNADIIGVRAALTSGNATIKAEVNHAVIDVNNFGFTPGVLEINTPNSPGPLTAVGPTNQFMFLQRDANGYVEYAPAWYKGTANRSVATNAYVISTPAPMHNATGVVLPRTILYCEFDAVSVGGDTLKLGSSDAGAIVRTDNTPIGRGELAIGVYYTFISRGSGPAVWILQSPTQYRNVSRIGYAINADFTFSNVNDPDIVIVDASTPLTADRVVTLPVISDNIPAGRVIEFVRQDAGAFTFSFAGKLVPANASARAVWSGTAWSLISYGAL